jgi:hypothetical protein
MSTVPPTLLSTFEILFTPQLPANVPVPSAVQNVIENVVKGYFLTLSNPNPTAYTFSIGFHCDADATTTQETLASAVAFLDDPTGGTGLTLSPSSTTNYSASVNVVAGGTVLIGVLPAFFSPKGLQPATIECRGWVDISLPALLKKVGQQFTFEPQSSGPVTVIATPEQRLTFLPVGGDVATAVEAQSAFALPLAGGAAALSIPPQPATFLIQPISGETVGDADAATFGRMLAGSST